MRNQGKAIRESRTSCCFRVTNSTHIGTDVEAVIERKHVAPLTGYEASRTAFMSIRSVLGNGRSSCAQNSNDEFFEVPDFNVGSSIVQGSFCGDLKRGRKLFRPDY